ncbi:MAG: hypothetical protein H7Z41_17305 [Cytophagales bacterium]|nr:hypothetical protein [Armatimonadota bacterium]
MHRRRIIISPTAVSVLFRFFPLSSLASIVFAVAACLLSGCGGGSGGGGGGAAPQTLSSASNYLGSINPARWQQRTVSFHIQPPSGEDTGVVETVRDGIEQWNPAVGDLVELQRQSGRADVEVEFVAPGSLGPSVIGRSTWNLRSDTRVIISARILIDSGMPPRQMWECATHEAGHILGIEGHSPNPEDVMYFQVTGEDQITASDRNTARALYGDLPSRNSHPPEETPPPAGITVVTVCETTWDDLAGPHPGH